MGLLNGLFGGAKLKKFYMACEQGNTYAVKKFLDRGIIDNLRFDFSVIGTDYTPLMVASMHDQVDVARILLEYGLDVNAKKGNGTTALMLASIHGNLNAAKLLLEHEADVNLKNNKGNTALMDASYHGSIEIIKLLLDHRADINTLDNNGNTALDVALQKRRKEAASFLIENGAKKGSIVSKIASEKYYPTSTPNTPDSGKPTGQAKGDEEKTMLINGDWTKSEWEEKPVRVFCEVDAAMAFLSQEELPYLWNDVPAYIQKVDNDHNPQLRKKAAWTKAYLNHPDPEVIRLTLRDHLTPVLLQHYYSLTEFIPYFIIHPNPGIREEAAKKFWACSEGALPRLFGVFTGDYPGRIPNSYNITTCGLFKDQLSNIASILRKHCPPEKKEYFETQVAESFGPTYSDTTPAKQTGEVTFKEQEFKEKMGFTMTYEVYTARNKIDALAFLEKKKVERDRYYIIVETPEGNWGKDSMGIFKE